MRKFIILLAFLTSCKIQTEVRENAIHPEIANKENAIQIANKEKAVNVEPNAIHFEEHAVGHIESGAVKVDEGAIKLQGTIESGAFQGKIEAGAVQLPVNVQEGAIKMPMTLNVDKEAIKVDLQLKIEPGAIVISGVEKGGIQTQFMTPWWAWVIMGVLGLGWLITKFRRNTRSREITEKSIWDVLF